MTDIEALIERIADGEEKAKEELIHHIEELDGYKKRADAIMQQNPYCMILWDTNMKIVDANEAFIKLSGWSRQQTLSSTIRDFKYLAKSGEGFDETIRYKRQTYGEATFDFPRGIFTMERYTIPFFDAQGNIVNILSVYADITEKRKKEEEIQRMMKDAQSKADILTASAGQLEESLKVLAKGDLTTEAAVEGEDPLDKAKKNYNAAIDSIKSLLMEVNKSVGQVEDNTHDAGKGTDEVAKAAEGVANSAQRCSENTKKLLDQIDEITREISDLSAATEEVTSTSQEIMQRAQKAAKEGAQAKDLGNQANTKMQAVERIAKQSVDEITKLNDQMREISNIVRLITDIANQTNLLALNAAIEAARAGEHGRGFAVVAGEVRNLAGESKSATNHIEEVINAITATTEKTASSMRTSYAEIQSGIESVNATIEALNRIIEETDVVARGITEITKATEGQANSTNNVLQRVESSAVLTKETQKQVEDMAALSEETSASTEEVASATHELSEMAGRLKKMVGQFTLS